LAAACSDKSALIWHLRPLKAVGAERLDACWKQLAAEPAVAFEAANAMMSEPDAAVALLKTRLRPKQDPVQERIAKLIADLNDDDFTKRKEATEALMKIGAPAVPALQRAVRQPASLEVKRRGETILAAIKETPQPLPVLLEGDVLRNVRAMQVLERIGTGEARKILDELAAGPITEAETAEARACVARLEQRKRLSGSGSR
jgi:hypothetical protein